MTRTNTAPIREESRRVWIPPPFLTALLILAAVVHGVNYIGAIQKHRIGIDFYQYWSVGQAARITDGAVRNPYVHHTEFNRVLAHEAELSDDPLYEKVAGYRSDLELQGTPMAYFVFSFFPAEYRQALTLHLVLQVSAFIAAVMLLLKHPQRPAPYCFLAACLLGPFYGPLNSELVVANFNCYLLLGLAVVFWACKRLTECLESGERDGRSIFILSTCSISVAGVLSLLKPSLAPTVPAIGLFLLARLGLRRSVSPVGFGGVIVGAVACIPMIYFGTSTIWTDWLRYFGNSNLDMFDLPFESGNTSLPLWLSKNTGLPFGSTAVLLFTIIVLTLILATRRYGSLDIALRYSVAKPGVAISLGITTFFAISPLAWVHYHVLLLVPGLLLLNVAGLRQPKGYVAFLGLLFAATTLVHFLNWIGNQQATTIALYGTMFSWPLLWIAILLAVGEKHPGETPVSTEIEVTTPTSTIVS